MKDFVAIDFETANSKRSSICQIGICEVVDGIPQPAKSWLVRPEGNKYDFSNMYVHGIVPEDTECAPSFPEIWQQVKPYLQGKVVVSHNTSFDMYALRDALDLYGIEYPDFIYFCSLRIAKHLITGLYSYSLNVLLQHFGIDFFNHHDAGADAQGCAMVMLKCMQLAGGDFWDLQERLKFDYGSFRSSGEFEPFLFERVSKREQAKMIALKVDVKPDESNYFFGKTVCFTGACRFAKRSDMLSMIAVIGGNPADSVTSKTDVLVVGQQDYRVVGEDGMSRKQRRALELLEKGQQIEILSEAEFLERY